MRLKLSIWRPIDVMIGIAGSPSKLDQSACAFYRSMSSPQHIIHNFDFRFSLQGSLKEVKRLGSGDWWLMVVSWLKIAEFTRVIFQATRHPIQSPLGCQVAAPQ